MSVLNLVISRKILHSLASSLAACDCDRPQEAIDRLIDDLSNLKDGIQTEAWRHAVKGIEGPERYYLEQKGLIKKSELYTVEFWGSKNLRRKQFKTIKGARGYLGRMWGYVMEDPCIIHPDGSRDTFCVSLSAPKELDGVPGVVQ